MKELEQDTSAYRVQRPDGSWTNRVDRRMARWIGWAGLVFLVYLSASLVWAGNSFAAIFGVGAYALAVGACLGMSIKDR